MPSLRSLNWDGFSGGEDSATAAVDALSIPNGYCAVLDNIEPSAGRMKPRPGSRFITNRFKNIRWMGAFEKPDGGYALILDGSDLWGVTYSGKEFMIRESWVIDGSSISCARAGKYLIALVDSEGLSMVLYEKSNRLSWFNAKISNVGSPIASVTHVPKESNGTDSFGDAANGYVVNSASSAGYEVTTPRCITHTWVRVDGRDNKYSTISDGMPSAQVESYENIEQRIIVKSANAKNPDGTSINSCGGDVSISMGSITPPDGATHLRIYMTLAAPVPKTDSSESIASGLVLRWVEDIPVSLVSNLTNHRIPGSEGALNGSTNLAWSTGRDDIPPGGSIKVAGGRVFIGGGRTESNPGRVYFSSIADGSSDQLSKMLSFSFSDDFIDTSTDDSERVVGMAISHSDLIIFNTKSVYNLASANVDSYPRRISSTHGAVGGITEINQQAFYLSKSGPAVVSGTTIDDVESFKSDMARPGLTGKSMFYNPGKVIHGIWHNDSWILSDGQNCAALLMRNGANRTWRITIGNDMGCSFSCNPMPGECWVSSPGKSIYALMDGDTIMDGSSPFMARIVTNATYVPKGSVCAEAYSMSTLTQWSDKWQIRLSIIGDNTRVSQIFEFEESSTTGAASSPDPITRGEVMQGVQSGVVSHWFQCGLDKYIHGKTLFGPIRLDIIPRSYHAESISVSEAASQKSLDLAYFGFDPINENISE